MMHIQEALKFGEEAIKHRSDIPLLEAQWLLEWILGENRIYLLLNGEKPLSHSQESAYREALARRAEGNPLQYIIGEQEFMGLNFLVNEQVLIPRRDTECLVELVVEKYRSASEGLVLSDLGSGSGAIGVSLAHFLKGSTVTCVDFSEGAVAMTAKNSLRLLEDEAVERFRALHMDMFDYLSQLEEGSQDLILSNPPYIPTEDIEALQTEVKLHEPRTALDGGTDGYDYYRRLVVEAQSKLKSGGWILFEVGHDQAERVKELFLDCGGYEDIQCYRDLQGIYRIVGAHKS